MNFSIGGKNKYKFLQKDMIIVPVKDGFSWTTFFFGTFALVFRGQFIIALLDLLMSAIVYKIQNIYGLSTSSEAIVILLLLVRVFLSLNVNDWKINKLIKKGFKEIESPFGF